MSARLLPLLASLLLLFVLACAGCETSPREITMFSGSTVRVAAGRVIISFLNLAEVWREDLQAHAEGARLEIRCDGVNHEQIVFADRATESPCGIRVQLLEVIDHIPPTVKLKVSWHD